MSLPAFQSALLRLIVNPAFRDAVRAPGALPASDLTVVEANRLRRIAADPGLDTNRTLHKGFRMGKLRTLLPLTCTLLGPKRLGREVAAFWQRQPPAGFSFLPEALEFIAFLRKRRLRVRYLDEVLAYEHATLELERARTGAAPPQRVVFEHDPAMLLSALAQGRRPRGVPQRRCVAIGLRDRRQQVQWALMERDETFPNADVGHRTPEKSVTPANAGVHFDLRA
jgi:hypothetical protein